MASPAFRSESHASGSDSSFTASEPAGAASGDALLLFYLIENGYSGHNPPSGWTPEAAQDVGPFTAFIYKLRRGGSAPSLSVSWTTARYFEWYVIATSGAVASGEFVDAAAAGSVVTTSAPDGPSIITNTTDTLVYSIVFTWAGWSSAVAPAGYTVRAAPATFDAGIASKALGAPATEDPGNWSGAGSDSTWSYTLAIASEAAAAAKGDNAMSAMKNLLRRTSNYRR